MTPTKCLSELAYDMIPMPPHGTPEWLEARKGYIGGSESAAALGQSQWQTQHNLYCTKMGLAQPKESSIAMEIGNAVEPVILREFMARTGEVGEKPDFMAVSKEYPWMSANLDWLSVCQTKAADAKNSIATGKWGDEDTDEFPLDYFFQCQHTMVVIPTIQLMYLVALLPYYKLKIYRIEPDRDVQDHIIKGTKQFYDMMLSGIEPNFDPRHPLAVSELKQRYNTVEDKHVVIPEAVALTVDRYKAVTKEITTLTNEKKSLQAILLDRMGDAKLGDIGKQYTLKRHLIAPKPYYAEPEPYTKLTISAYKDKN